MSFNTTNIKGGFEKVGIWLYLLLIVLNIINNRFKPPPEPLIKPLGPPPTLLTSKSIRRAQRTY